MTGVWQCRNCEKWNYDEHSACTECGWQKEPLAIAPLKAEGRNRAERRANRKKGGGR